jgi:hypothetical protein
LCCDGEAAAGPDPAKIRNRSDPHNIHHPRHWTHVVAGRFHGAFQDESVGNVAAEPNNGPTRPDIEQRSVFERSGSNLCQLRSIQVVTAPKLPGFWAQQHTLTD